MENLCIQLATINVQWGLIPLWGTVALGVLSGLFGVYVFSRSRHPKWAFAGYLILFLGWTGVMFYIGKQQGACPIHGTGQVLVFLCWSLTLFYLVAGTAYRLSFLGGMTGIMVMLLSAVVFSIGIVPAESRGDIYQDLHVGCAILACAAFSLSMLASVAVLVQDRHLKEHRLEGSYRKLPKLNLLNLSVPKLVMWGIGLLTLSIGFVWSSHSMIPVAKLVVACGAWSGYVVLICVWKWRGMPAKWFAIWNIVVFVLILTVIFLSQ